MPLALLGTAVPAAFVPMSFPSTRHDAPTEMPLPPFPEMTLVDPAVVPPIVAPDEKMAMPELELGMARVPARFVPMKFPSTRHDASTAMPLPFPEMTLFDPAVVPPIVAPGATTLTP